MRTIHACVLCVTLTAPPVQANDGPVILLQGGSIRPIDDEGVELVKERVRIKTWGPPSDGAYYMSKVRVEYFLRNTRQEARTMTTGFPLANYYSANEDLVEGVMKFRMRDGKKKVPIHDVVSDPESSPTCWVLTQLSFKPLEDKKLTISYEQQWKGIFDSLEGIDDEQLVYMLTPARHWAGKIGTADIAMTFKTKRNNPFGAPIPVDPCNLAFSIEPSEVKAGKSAIVVRWLMKDYEPSTELFAYYSHGSCDSKQVGVENAVSNYLRNAELQLDGPQDNLEAALNDILYLTPEELEKRRYDDYEGNEGAWDLPTLLTRHFVPDSPHKLLGEHFYLDVKSKAAQDRVKSFLSQLITQQ